MSQLFGHFRTRVYFALRVSYFGFLLLLGCATHGQILKPVDPGKLADDINNKNIDLGDVNLGTISPGMRQTTRSSLSDKNVHFKGVNLSDVKLRSLNLSDVQMKALPQQNFTAKHAAVSGQMHREAEVKTANARIRDRQIHAFTPAGEEELKKQLHDIPPPQPAK